MDVTVNVTGLGSVTGSLAACNLKMPRYQLQAEQFASHCALEGETGTGIRSALRQQANVLETLGGQLRSLEQTLRSVRTAYLDSEGKLTGRQIYGEKVRQRKAAEAASGKTESELWKYIGKMGIVGSGAETLYRMVNNSGTPKDWIKLGKSISTFTGNVAMAAKTKTQWTSYLLGGNNSIEKLEDLSTAGSTYVSSIKKSLGTDLNILNAEGTAAKVASATKWAGYILTFASNGVENYQEMKTDGISGERAVEETILESIVDVGLTVSATAAVSAGVVALGFASGPAAAAAVVGVGAVTVIWAANGICKWISGGRDLGEVVADGICDLGEEMDGNSCYYLPAGG